MPKVSIIMPVYNAEKYLSRALNSVGKQPFTDFELVCVNDGSTDASLQILHKHKKHDDRIKIINQENGGGSAARNAGIAYATGEYVMFLDADDEYAGDIIAHAYNRAEKTNADIVLYNFARFVGKPTRLAVVSKISPGNNIDLFTKETYTSRFFNDFATITWNKLVKRSVIADNNIEFDSSLSHNHDVDFSIRLMLAAKSYSWLNEVGYFYRSNDSGLTATKRDDPTNVLKILMNLREQVISSDRSLVPSFDAYVVDMIMGTLTKYNNNTHKQREVFDFSHNNVIPTIQIQKTDNLQQDELFYVKTGDYNGYITYSHSPRRRLRAWLRRIYDVIQRLWSFFVV